MNIKGLPKCRCGGKPIDVTTRYAYGAIVCDTCGIRTKDEHCDNMNYGKEARKVWRTIMKNNQEK